MPEDPKQQTQSQGDPLKLDTKFDDFIRTLSPAAKALVQDNPEMALELYQQKGAQRKQYDEIVAQQEALQKRISDKLKIMNDLSKLVESGAISQDEISIYRNMISAARPSQDEFDALNKLSTQATDLLRGVSKQEVEQIKGEQRVSLGSGKDSLSMTRSQLLDYIQDPQKAQDFITSLRDQGQDKSVEEFTNLIAQTTQEIQKGNLSDSLFPNQPQETPQPQPVQPVDNQLAVGNDQSFIENIKNNIRSMLGSPQEKVKQTSSALKSNANKQGVA